MSGTTSNHFVTSLQYQSNCPVKTRRFPETYHFLELGLDLLRGELLAQRGLPQEHVTVVGQQLWTLGLWLSFQTYPVKTGEEN